MSEWYYAKARRASDGTWVGWLGWSPQGYLRFNGEETDKDPSKLSDVTYVNALDSNPKVLRAPDYHLHGSAYLGGVGDNGYYAAWHWLESGGYKLTIDGQGIVRSSNGYILSVYRWGKSNDASWEPNLNEAVTLEFVKRAKPT